MKIYKVIYEVPNYSGSYSNDYDYKYFVSKEKAEKFVAEKDVVHVNSYGIVYHSAKLDGYIEAEE